MKPTSSPQDQEQDQKIINLLKELGSLKVQYPPELLAERRSAFITQVEQSKGRIKEELPSRKQFINRLEDLKSLKSEYPQELLAARRAAFIAHVEQLNQTEVREELFSKDQGIIKLLRHLSSVQVEYPPKLLAAQRAAFIRRAVIEGKISLFEALRASIQNIFRYQIKLPSMPTMSMLRPSLVVASLIMATFVGTLLGNPQLLFRPSPAQQEISQPGPVSAATSNGEVAKVFCKPGYMPPLCLARKINHIQILTFQGNESARPAVAKDTLPGYSGVHEAAYLNDGLYGPGSSWVRNSAYSYIKKDLGKETTINTVTFGRDRLGNFNDRSPGQFIIAVALSDNAYVDGNSSNDYIEYTEVYDSGETGFNGVVSGSETIRAQFNPVPARFIKITFANSGTAIDEVEAFMVQPAIVSENPTRKPKNDLPTAVSIFIPTNTSLSTDTPVPAPTNTPVPTDTATPVPTDTPLPTDTPQPTDTPIPPTDTSIPPTDTPISPTDTSIPPTDPVEPTIVPTDTSALFVVP